MKHTSQSKKQFHTEKCPHCGSEVKKCDICGKLFPPSEIEWRFIRAAEYRPLTFFLERS